ncbi:GbsR/MarR family transcriptional regulator [Polluticaenibacter yanchengensis]|uniref:HTH-type transcriptional regulator n=1 Tax=Polluticaenibacter yanchengensis TaxID=3014562 RepID=A0ABT4UEE4_9BACT|nr:transcriptional regulator [Chitinophagaceae bacterium LY-5]
MKLDEAKEKFVQTWGSLATSWGINRTMAMVHALLLTSQQPLSTDEVMEQLAISRGNANMNLRELMDWGIVKKELKIGDRKEYFVADKDIWTVFKHIVKERRKRELEPVIHSLESLKNVEDNNEESKAFRELMDNLLGVTTKANVLLDLAVKSDENWMMNKLLKLLS